MTDHLYYHDSYIHTFEANIVAWVPVSSTTAGSEGRMAAVLDETYFYPTSGGQPFDTGLLAPKAENSTALRVTQVEEDEQGRILHFVQNFDTGGGAKLSLPLRVHGTIDADRRGDHMQQHTGQHILSAAFIRALNMPTLSFHLGTDFCSIDIDAKSLTPEQAAAAEQLANEVVMEDRSISMRFVPIEEARTLGLRKLPEVGRDELRLIDIHDFDLTACGGTHVRRTGEVGCILLRKIEKVKQGIRVGFVCGLRAVATARQDYAALADSAALYSAPMWELPQLIRKSQDEARAQRKYAEGLLQDLAALEAERLIAQCQQASGVRLVRAKYDDRDAAYIKLLAQRLVRNAGGVPVIALLGATLAPPGLVFAQSAGLTSDMGALLKELLAHHAGRGGGTKEMAQGGVPDAAKVEAVLAEAESRLRA